MLPRDASTDVMSRNSQFPSKARQISSPGLEISERNTSKDSSTTQAEDRIKRRRELRQARRQRAREELLEDYRPSQGGYDADARIITITEVDQKMIAVPEANQGQNTEGNLISPQHLGNFFRQVESNSVRSQQRDRIRNYSRKLPKPVSTAEWMHANDDNASKSVADIKEHSEGTVSMPGIQSAGKEENPVDIPDEGGDTSTSVARRDSNNLDVLLSPVESLPRLPHERSVIHMRRAGPDKILLPQEEVTQYPKAIEVPSSLNLLSLGLPDIGESMHQEQYRSTSRRQISFDYTSQNEPNVSGFDTAPTCDLQGIPPSSWLRGASGILRPSNSERHQVPSSRYEHNHNHNTAFSSDCNPVTEELYFGGLDGEIPGNNAANPSAEYNDISKSVSETSLSVHEEIAPGLLELRPSPSRSVLLNTRFQPIESPAVHERDNSISDDSTKQICNEPDEHWKSISNDLQIRSLKPRNPAVVDRSSSIYTSQAYSLTPSPNSSIARIPNLFDALRLPQETAFHSSPYQTQTSLTDLASETGGPLDTFESEFPRHRTSDGARFCSGIDNVGTKAFVNPQSNQFGEEVAEKPEEIAGVLGSQPDESDFTKSHPNYGDGALDEWHPSNRRHGYGYGSVSGRSTSEIGHHVSLSHADHLTSVPENETNFLLQGYTTPSQNDVSEVNKAKGGSLMIRTNFDDITGVESKGKGVFRDPSITFPDSWSRYPSHTRASRSPVEAADGVKRRDFAPDIQVGLDKKKSRSMTFRKNVLKTCSKLYKSPSWDFKQNERGNRSSMALKKPLEYPELERIAPDPLFRIRKQPSYGLHSIGSVVALQLNKSEESVVPPSPHAVTTTMEPLATKPERLPVSSQTATGFQQSVREYEARTGEAALRMAERSLSF